MTSGEGPEGLAEVVVVDAGGAVPAAGVGGNDWDADVGVVPGAKDLSSEVKETLRWLVEERWGGTAAR